MTKTTEQQLQASVQELPEVRRRILVADDDKMTLEILRVIIEQQGYEAVTVNDGREAFEILQTDADFCAVIVDMNMPKLSGLDVLNYMKATERLREIPIAMITVEQDPRIWNASLAVGAAVFLPKPFTAPQIKMTLQMLTQSGKV